MYSLKKTLAFIPLVLMGKGPVIIYRRGMGGGGRRFGAKKGEI